MIGTVAYRSEESQFLGQGALLGQLFRQFLWIKAFEIAQRAVDLLLVVKLRRAASPGYDRAAEVSPPVAGIQAEEVEPGCQGLHRFLQGAFGLLKGGQQVVGQVPAQVFRCIENVPGTAGIELRREVGALGIFFAEMIPGMAGPHLGRLRQLGGKDPVILPILLRQRGHFAQIGLIEDDALMLQDSGLHGEHVFGGVPGVQLLLDKVLGLFPGAICGGQPVKRVDEGIAAAGGNGDQVRLELHLPGEGPLRQHDQAEEGVQDGSNRPNDELHEPADPGDPEVDPREEAEDGVQRVAVMDEVDGDLLGRVNPASDGHGALREVTELMSQDCLELAEVQNVDQAETDFQVLPGREEKVQEGQIVEDAGIDRRRKEDLVRARRAGLLGHLPKKREQARLGFGGDLKLLGPA